MEAILLQLSARYNQILLTERQASSAPCWQELQHLAPGQVDGLLMLLTRVHEDFTLLVHELQRCHEGIVQGE